MNKIRNNYTKEIVYFKFFTSMKYPNCFWYTRTTENFGFEMGKINDYTPLRKTWKEIHKNEKKH